jgi:uncharacterized protein (TIGR03437 family)
MRQGLRIALICLASWAQLAAQPSPAWILAGSMHESRYYHQSVLLENGKMLVSGGQAGCVTGYACRRVNSPELYDPLTGTWDITGDMLNPRSNHFAVRLSSGKVLIGGGFLAGATNTAEIYDHETKTWSATGDMNSVRGATPTATLLRNGRVLVAGGGPANNPYAGLRTAELYDPATGVWSLTAAMNDTRNLHTATLLPDGRVLVASGVDLSASSAMRSSAEIYDPATGTWTLTGSLQRARAYHTANLLASGKVLVTGGMNLSSGSVIESAELYDPATGQWTETGKPSTARVSHTATSLADGRVLVAGGYYGTSGNPVLGNAEIYDPAVGTWTAAPNMAIARGNHAATLLANGKVIVTGGHDAVSPGYASAEIFDSGASSVTTVSAASPTPVGVAAVESIASIYGSDLASETLAAANPPPTALAGVSVNIRDKEGVSRPAPLFMVSPGQVNFLVPSGTPAGAATVVVLRGEKAVAMGPVSITLVAPGLFAANGGGKGVAAASVLRVKADGFQSVEPVAIYDTAQHAFTTAPIDFGPATDQLFLILYGTGIRRAGKVSSAVGGVDAEVLFAGAAPGWAGLDQVNVRLPRSLSGRGAVDVSITADGQNSNALQVSFR